MTVPACLLPRWGSLTTFPYMGTLHAHWLGYYLREARTAFEMGSGGSTLFALMVNPALRLVSVEHDPTWRAKVHDAHAALAASPVEIGWRLDLGGYDESSIGKAAPYDVVLIDGDRYQRAEWMARTWPAVRPGGVLLLHDAERKEYEQAKADIVADGTTVLYDDTDPTYVGSARLWIARKP